ncbi:MAG: hypothetical protein ACMG6S_14755, partial [Byssovorax sp.]
GVRPFNTPDHGDAMSFVQTRLLAALGLLTIAPLSVVTCAVQSTPPPSTGGGAGLGGSSSSGSTGGTGGSGGSGGSGGGEIIPPSPDGGTDGGVACVSVVAEAEIVPLDMFILLDRSGSMTSSNKWTSAVTAIKGFSDTPGVAGMGLGLQYFPPLKGDECSVPSYQSPAVPLALLPGNASPIKISLVNTMPTGLTPMRPALEGVTKLMKAHVLQNPTHEGVVILVTDGDPGGCTNNTVSAVSAVAADSATTSPEVRTFVVGMTGASFGNLDTIAAAGGTTKSFDVGSGVGASQALIDALDKIRTSALSCEYLLPIPDPKEGKLDFDSVKIQFTPGLNEPKVDIQKVGSKALCGDISGGFYYDDPTTPTRLILCQASCNLIHSGTENASVRVVLGCIKPPAQ